MSFEEALEYLTDPSNFDERGYVITPNLSKLPVWDFAANIIAAQQSVQPTL